MEKEGKVRSLHFMEDLENTNTWIVTEWQPQIQKYLRGKMEHKMHYCNVWNLSKNNYLMELTNQNGNHRVQNDIYYEFISFLLPCYTPVYIQIHYYVSRLRTMEEEEELLSQLCSKTSSHYMNVHADEKILIYPISIATKVYSLRICRS